MAGTVPEARSLTIAVPGIPPGPNVMRTKHWSFRSRVSKQFRGDTHLVAIDARNKSGATFPWDHVRVTYEFHVPNRNRHDPDNLIAACKPILDGIRDAGIIADDSGAHVTIGPPAIIVTPRLSSVHVLIERLDAA